MVWCSVIQLTAMCIVKEPSVIQQVGVLCALISFSVFFVCLFVCLFFCVLVFVCHIQFFTYLESLLVSPPITSPFAGDRPIQELLPVKKKKIMIIIKNSEYKPLL